MLYYETNRKWGRRIAAMAAFLYVAAWIAAMWLVTFRFEPELEGEGLLIDFGNSEFASGVTDTEEFADPEASAASGDAEPITTQDLEDAPAVSQPEREQPSQTTPQESRREVNQRALFPGRTQGSAPASERTAAQGMAAQGAGNQGTPDGSQRGSHDGTGAGMAGAGFSLEGRSVVGSLPAPTYGANKQGRVVVEIVVDAAGNVRSAAYRPQGSTTNDGDLVGAALRAARQSRFNPIEGDVLQTGTITYNFTLR